MGSAIEPDALSLPLNLQRGLEEAGGRGADERTALKAFDAYFLGEILKQSAPQNPTGLLDGGEAGRMYQDHLYEELARIMAESGEFGIAKSLEGKLTPAAREGDRKSEAPGGPVEERR